MTKWTLQSMPQSRKNSETYNTQDRKPQINEHERKPYQHKQISDMITHILEA